MSQHLAQQWQRACSLALQQGPQQNTQAAISVRTRYFAPSSLNVYIVLVVKQPASAARALLTLRAHSLWGLAPR